jgi:hypothetical protein
MTCIEDKTIPQEIRRVINNGYFVSHPFKGAYLREMMSVFKEVQKLDRDQSAFAHRQSRIAFKMNPV